MPRADNAEGFNTLLRSMVVPRPTFLVAEPMPLEGISARKLVLEAARYNVITGYNAADANDLLERFPKVDGLVVHSGLGNGDNSYRDVIDKALTGNPKCFIVLISPDRVSQHPGVKYHLSSHDPKMLLDLLLEQYPPPEMR